MFFMFFYLQSNVLTSMNRLTTDFLLGKGVNVPQNVGPNQNYSKSFLKQHTGRPAAMRMRQFHACADTPPLNWLTLTFEREAGMTT